MVETKEIVELVVPLGIAGEKVAEEVERMMMSLYGKRVRAYVRRAR